MRQKEYFDRAKDLLFQSTHPLRGATIFRDNRTNILTVSIHAPLARCDFYCISICNKSNCFNPRTPCEVRPQRQWESYAVKCFNPRTPCEVRLISVRGSPSQRCFNPRTPCEVRPFLTAMRFVQILFQSTHPLRGATFLGKDYRHRCNVSIHAPLARCDCL